MPTEEKRAVLSIAYMDARSPEKGAQGVMWILPVSQAEALQEEFTATYGKPVSAMVPGDKVKDLHDDPNLIINNPEESP